MKIGVKIWAKKDKPFLDKLSNLADFIEVMALKGNDYSFVNQYELPVVIHNPHIEMGVNISNPDRLENNLNSLKFSKDVMNLLEAKGIIVHLGPVEHDKCSINYGVNVLRNFGDKDFLIENLSGKSDFGAGEFGSSCDQIKKALSKTKSGFCLDIGHAALAALFEKKGMINTIREFIRLKPNHFHVCDVRVSELRDHFYLGEGDLNFHSILKMLPRNAWITIETGTDAEKVRKDIEFLKEINDSL